jgi:putative MATE family efflux protein
MARPGSIDLTNGPIARTLLLFALPTLGSSILQSLNASINAVWIGQFLGERALAATTNASLVMFLLFAVIFGFGMAATILIGQAMGRRDIDAARRVLGSALGLFLILSAVTTLAGWLGADALLRLLATPAEVRPLALDYLRVIFLSMPPSFIVVLLTMGLRGTGDSMTPLIFMGLTAALDVVLNPLFILGLGPVPAYGIAGSALATLIANLAGLIGLVAYIYARDLTVRLRGAELRYILPDPALLRTILGKGVPMGLQMLVVSSSALIMIGLVNRFGTVTTAAYGAATQLWTYVQMPAMAVGAAVSAMAAQNIGAGKWERVGRISRAGVLMNCALTGVLVVLITLADRPALALFLGSDSVAMEIGVRMNLIVGWSWILFGISIVLASTVRANGAVVGPLVILFIALLPVRVGFAAALEPWLGADAIWWSFPAGSLASVVMTIGFYRHGGWRKGRLLPPMGTTKAEQRTMAGMEPAGKAQPIG